MTRPLFVETRRPRCFGCNADDFRFGRSLEYESLVRLGASYPPNFFQACQQIRNIRAPFAKTRVILVTPKMRSW